MIDSRPSPAGNKNGQLAETTQTPMTVIQPPSGWAAIDFGQIWLYRDLLMALASRDVKLRYRQTALGVIWVILQPLLAAGIFSFVFGVVAGLSSDGVPYILFSYAGLLGWNAFSNTVTKASAVLVQNSNLVSKIFFPRLLLPFSTVFSTLLDTAVASVMAIGLMVYYHVMPTAGLLLLPVWFAMIMVMALGVGLFTSALMVSYRDVQYVVPVAVQMLMYASPVAYSTSKVPAQYQFIFNLNPIAPLLQGFRWSLLGIAELNIGALTYACLFSLGLFFVGAAYFKKAEKRFADVI